MPEFFIEIVDDIAVIVSCFKLDLYLYSRTDFHKTYIAIHWLTKVNKSCFSNHVAWQLSISILRTFVVLSSDNYNCIIVDVL